MRPASACRGLMSTLYVSGTSTERTTNSAVSASLSQRSPQARVTATRRNQSDRLPSEPRASIPIARRRARTMTSRETRLRRTHRGWRYSWRNPLAGAEILGANGHASNSNGILKRQAGTQERVVIDSANQCKLWIILIFSGAVVFVTNVSAGRQYRETVNS